MFVIILTYVKPVEEVDKALAAHRKWLDDGYTAGRFLASGPRIPRTGGVILARFDSEAALRAELEKDPFWSQGLAKYEIVEFIPNRTAPRLYGHF